MAVLWPQASQFPGMKMLGNCNYYDISNGECNWTAKLIKSDLAVDGERENSKAVSSGRAFPGEAVPDTSYGLKKNRLCRVRLEVFAQADNEVVQGSCLYL